MPANNPVDYGEIMSQFPQTQGRYIKIPNDGDSFTGQFLEFGTVKMGSYGPQYPALFLEVQLDENGAEVEVERELSCGKALMQAFQKANVQTNEVITITRSSEEGVNRETNEGTGEFYTRYEITRPEPAAPAPAAPRAPAARPAAARAGTSPLRNAPAPRPAAQRQAAPADETINIEDIPF